MRKSYIFSLVINYFIFGGVVNAACPEADLDGDCQVGMSDLQILAGDWLHNTGTGSDFDSNSVVDFRDFGVIASQWSKNGIRLQVNEIMSDNSGTIEDPDQPGKYPDWIELYNYGTVAINTAGLTLSDAEGTWVVPSGQNELTTIMPGGFLLFWADGETARGPLHTSFKLSSSGDSVTISLPDSSIVDTIEFGTLGKDESFGRYPNGANAWQVFANGTATPGSTNGGDLADSAIVISEIMYHPAHNKEVYEPEPLGLEYLELYNTGSSVIDIGGWRFVKGVDFVVPADTKIAADGRLVIAADTTAFSAKYPSVTNVIGNWVGRLSNTGEKITLVNNTGRVIDEVEYYDQGNWSQRILGPLDYNHRGWLWSDGSDGAGQSLELICPAISNEYGQNWRASSNGQGTPGTANTANASTLPPFFFKAKNTPAIPNASQQVAVTAEITSALSQVSAVTLHWRLDSSVYSKNVYPTYNPASYTTVTMYDDGQHNDGQPGDKVYGAFIPAQADTSIVEYFIEAVDTNGNVSTCPAPCLVDGVKSQVANMLYQVNNNFAAETAWQVGKQPVYYLIMTQAEFDRLADIGNDSTNNEQYSNATMNGTFVSVDGVDTKVRYCVGFRNRGEGSRKYPPNNYRVDFLSDDLWKGLTEININSKYTYNQLVGSAIFRTAGMVCADAKAIQVRVNGQNLALTESIPSRMHGTYVHMEAINKDFAERHFPDDPDGNAYKASIYPQIADLTYQGTDPADYVARGFSKATNGSENNWSDLINLTNVLENEPDETYIQKLEQVIDTDQWIRWFAVQALIGNKETNLSNGYGDDYRMFCGVNDPRFVLVMHDMDTILGGGDTTGNTNETIWQCIATHSVVQMAVIQRFLQHPDYTWKYYAQLRELANTVFAAESINPLLDSLLRDFVPESQIATMKQFAADRRLSVLNQIPHTFAINTDLTELNGYYHTTTSELSLSGTADAVETLAVRVAGQMANWNHITGAWSISNLTLQPGINRIIVETYSNSTGTWPVVHSDYIDIWYEDGTESVLSGTLASDRLLTSAQGPWHITADVVIPAGISLSIEPGTTLFFESGTGITVHGTLSAQGSDYSRITMTSVPGTGSWDGLAFTGSMNDNQLNCVDMVNGDSQGCSLVVSSSRLTIEKSSWVSSGTEIMILTHPSLSVNNSLFPAIMTNPVISGTGLSGSEYLVLTNNTFMASSGSNDIIAFSDCQKPGPILELYNNRFLGGGDDAIELDNADAHIEGNYFTGFHKLSTDPAEQSFAISAGYGSGISLAGNVFSGNDNGILFFEGSFGMVANNTIIDSDISAVSFGQPQNLLASAPALSVYFDSNIFWNNANTFEHYFDSPAGYGPTGSVVVNNCLLPVQWHDMGTGNLSGDPLLDNTTHITPGSIAAGSGSCGQDMGAFATGGMFISGRPYAGQNSIVLNISGAGITSYKYRVLDNGVAGNWSSEIALPLGNDLMPIDPYDTNGHITLTGLSAGHTYQIEALGRNYAGIWQTQISFSDLLLTEPETSKLQINEILARNSAIGTDSTYPDMIELYYEGSTPLDLGGYSLTDNDKLPTKYVFPAGTIMNPGDYLVIYADTAITPGIHCGFTINASGDDLSLFSPSGILIDSVVFGNQLDNFSIGRVDNLGNWTLTEPSFGQPNQKTALGNCHELKINEWLAAGQTAFTSDWIELYNPGQLPVDLGGLALTDDPVSKPARSVIIPLSYIAQAGYAVFTADNNQTAGHVGFSLSADGQAITLYDTAKTAIDSVLFAPQTADVSQGRKPDGGMDIVFFDLATPGASNALVDTVVNRETLVAINAIWSYNQTGSNLNTAWQAVGYDDSSWPTGAALLYNESSSLPAPKNTQLTLGKTTYYFRKHFTYNGDLSSVDNLYFSTVLDDGAAFYLNGVNVLRVRLAEGAGYQTAAQSPSVDNAGYEYFTVSADALKLGDNVIAVEVHQISSTSTDIAFGAKLETIGRVKTINDTYTPARKVRDSLRVTELMYHPDGNEAAEYIELQNTGSETIDLTGVRLGGDIDFSFPAMELAAGEYVVVVADQAVFTARYGNAINVAGTYTGLLSNSSGEIIVKLAEPLDAAVMRFNWLDAWLASTDGQGHSLVLTDTSLPVAEYSLAASWRESFVAGGSPGRADIANVIINEILAHSHATLPDWIELYNPASTAVDISGWYLSDDRDNLMKYQLGEGSVIPAGDYLVLYEDVDFGSYFAMSENGESLYLSSAENGVLTGYLAEVSFGASQTGASFGRYIRSDGTAVYPAMASVTPGEVNSLPATGPIVISEIMYNPTTGGSYAAQEYEYIELHNITSQPVTLEVFDADKGVTLPWQFTAGIDYTFALGTTIPANGYLIVAKNPAAFAQRYGSPAGVQITGPFANSTSLSNSGELLELSLPGDTDLTTRYYISVDKVLYDDEGSWPAGPDGNGQALGRIDQSKYGDDVINWQGVNPLPGI